MKSRFTITAAYSQLKLKSYKPSESRLTVDEKVNSGYYDK